MRATGIVIETDKSVAKVKSTRESACSSCHNCEAKGACHAELIFGSQTEEVYIFAKNTIGAMVGDRVELESSTTKTLFASASIFVLPVILSALSYILSERFVSIFRPEYVFLTVLIISFMVLARIINIFAKRRLATYIVRILEESETEIEGK